MDAQIITREGDLYLRVYHSPSRQIGKLFDTVRKVSEGTLDLSLEDFKTSGASDAIIAKYRVKTANPTIAELNEAVKELKGKK